MSAGSGRVTALLADVGGTNARFALLQDGKGGEAIHLPVAEYPTAYDAVAAAMERLGCLQAPQAAVLAFAGPVDDARAVMTNAGWDTTIGELRQRFGFSHIRLLNDYAALALALPHFAEADRLIVGPARPAAQGALAVLGPGSGLGVAALVQAEPHGIPLVSEGGHATMPAADALEAELIAALREDFGHVSAERLLSGPGLVNIYRGLARVQGQSASVLTAAEITDRGLDGSDGLCRLALERFCLFLGTFAGNVALGYGAQGGVFLAGGILPRFPDFLAASGFRDRFQDKGRFHDYLEAIPTWLIVRPDAAFVGLAAAARQFA
ncbi:glucokinase [Pelagibius sp. 7325]|uniref:glucokinase n=1 Tax=Pelagibius sp. 7325 TaxID=3131994 RepID=UPI0030ED595D